MNNDYKNAKQTDLKNYPTRISKEMLAEFEKLSDIQLINRYRKHNDIDARNYLVVRYMSLYFKLAHQYSNSLPFDETVQICALKCIEIIDKFDLTKNANSLSTILYVALPNALNARIKLDKVRSRKVSLFEKSPKMDENSESNYIEVVSAEDDVCMDRLHSADNRTALKSAINRLDKNRTEYKILALYYGFETGKEHNQKEIADILHLTQSAVSRSLSACHKKLREFLQERGYSAENML